MKVPEKEIGPLKDRIHRLNPSGDWHELSNETGWMTQVDYEGDSVTVTIYKNGTVLMQPAHEDFEAELEQMAANLVVEKESSPSPRLKPPAQTTSNLHIGSDETLKGDTFGGIIVAGFTWTGNLDDLKKLGVGDSKKISEKNIRHIARTLKSDARSVYAINSVKPLDYNGSVTGKGDLTIYLNELHHDVGRKVRDDLSAKAGVTSSATAVHVVDKFPGCSVGDIRLEKAEDRYLEVAAASILARAAMLDQLDALSKVAGFTLKKGSSDPEISAQLARLVKDGFLLQEFAKMHFGNVKTHLRTI